MADCTVSEVLKISEDEVGYLEKKTAEYLYDKKKNAGNKNCTKYAKDVYEKAKGFLNGNKQAKPYCAVGIIWTILVACDWDMNKARKVLCFDGSVDDGKAAAGVQSFKNYFKAKKRFDKNPKVGDAIFFNYDGGNDDHVGLVRKVTSTMVYTREWNTKKDGKGGVWDKSYKRNDSSIDGYGHPKYDSEPEPTPPTPEPPEPTPPAPEPTPTPDPKPKEKVVKASQPAEQFNSKFKGSYKVTASALNMRDGAGKKYRVLTVLDRNEVVRCYGYYSIENGIKWLFVSIKKDNIIYEGYCSSAYLKAL